MQYQQFISICEQFEKEPAIIIPQQGAVFSTQLPAAIAHGNRHYILVQWEQAGETTRFCRELTADGLKQYQALQAAAPTVDITNDLNQLCIDDDLTLIANFRLLPASLIRGPHHRVRIEYLYDKTGDTIIVANTDPSAPKQKRTVLVAKNVGSPYKPTEGYDTTDIKVYNADGTLNYPETHDAQIKNLKLQGLLSPHP